MNNIGFARRGALAAIIVSGLQIGAGVAAAADTDLIAFDKVQKGTEDIWVMGADGSNPVNLTNDKLGDAFAAWSPDGSRIAWSRGTSAHEASSS